MSDKIKTYVKLIEEKTGSPTFCALPWIHLATRPNGDARLCCVTNASGAHTGDHTVGLVKKEDGEPANFGRETPLEAFNNQYMRSVRLTMLEGKVPASCTKCFEEESNGVVSKRLWEMYEWNRDGLDFNKLISDTDSTGGVPPVIRYLDLRLGHTCNLKCVMCSPHDSSRWLQDYDKLVAKTKSTIVLKQVGFDKESFNNTWYEKPEFWDDVFEQIPNITQLYFAGGEPLMIREHKWFLEEIIRQGYADKILIRYNTNGLLVDDEIIELWKQFKKVKVGFSIDAIGDRNYYIRYPSDWATIEKNLHKLDNTPDNIQVSIATAIQILNIKHLADFAKWKITQNFKKVNLENTVGGIQAGGGIVNMHLLYIPTFLSIRLLPEADKAEVRKSFGDLANWLYINYRQDEDFWKQNPYGWKRWQAVLDFMDAEDHTVQLTDFKEYIVKLEALRGTNFKSTFPELAHLI